jgi:serine/threonine protein phosphatase PrpC
MVDVRAMSQPARTPVARIRCAAKTDVGPQRDHNEDCFFVNEADQLYLVADGMGGHAAGEVASKMAADIVSSFFRKSAGGDVTWPFKVDPELPLVENRLACAVKLASHHIFLDARADLARRGMGTTIVAAAIEHARIHIAHVGDSRCYRIREGEITRLTRDHTLLEEFKKFNPDMSEEEEKTFGHRSVLNRALGVRAEVEVDLQRHDLAPGDRYVLCSDGLSGPVDEWSMLAVIAGAGDDLDAAVTELIDRANKTGGTDNVTVILLSWA